MQRLLLDGGKQPDRHTEYNLDPKYEAGRNQKYANINMYIHAYTHTQITEIKGKQGTRNRSGNL